MLLARSRRDRAGLSFALIAVLAFLLSASPAAASKQVVDTFGEGEGTLGGQFRQSAGLAVNDAGAGPANAGDVYVIDSRCCQPPGDSSNNRIQRFGRDDNGTPGNYLDDSYFFISAWGADAAGTPSGGSDYEICTVASECKAGVASGGNGSLSLTGINWGAIAVDQDSGDVYVSDTGNHRVNVYDGAGTFLRSFGHDVVASGPGDSGTGYEVCVAADGDVCKAGLAGTGVGQITTITTNGIAVSPPDGNPATGQVFLADEDNQRVETFNLDGSSPSSFGSAAVFGLVDSSPHGVAVDSRGIVYVTNRFVTGSGQILARIERYDTQNANGTGVDFLAPILPGVNEEQKLTIAATAGTFNLTFEGETTVDLPFNVKEGDLRAAFRALPSVGRAGVELGGGPGNAAGSDPYSIRFENGLGTKDLPQVTVANGAVPLSGGSGGSVTTSQQGAPGLSTVTFLDLAVDPDEDGPGPDADVLYAGKERLIQQFGPLNSPGLTAPPILDDDRHGTVAVYLNQRGLAVEPTTGRLYATGDPEDPTEGREIYALDDASPTPPTASLDSLTSLTDHSFVAHGTVDPNGPPATGYHFEYSTDGTKWTSLPTVFLGSQEGPQAVEATIGPAPVGLPPNTLFHVRLVAKRRFAAPVTSNELTATTLTAAALAITTGSPVRTTTTARLSGRVLPRNSAAGYHFEYGTEGPCDVNPCAATPDMPAGSGNAYVLVAENAEGLEPDTTYHYRLVADNGDPAGPGFGEDMTVTTRASDQLPGQDDRFPGPPGSDRAWEMVSMADSGGNPVSLINGFADAGNRAAYGIAGGTPISNTGDFFSLYFAERPTGQHPQSGWATRSIMPARADLVGTKWSTSSGPADLSSMIGFNGDTTIPHSTLWRLLPDAAQPERLFAPVAPQKYADLVSRYVASSDGSRAVAYLRGGVLDPANPTAPANPNLYDVSEGGDPRLLGLLPDGTVPACGASFAGSENSHTLSEDGSFLYFRSAGDNCGAGEQLYARDVFGEESRLISGPPVSGPSCSASFLKGVPGAAFFATAARLDPDDLDPGAGCGAGGKGYDVYRYDLAGGALDCLTCVVPGVAVDVIVSPISGYLVINQVTVSRDGSRLYFRAATPPQPGTDLYRLNTESGDLAPLPAQMSPFSSLGTINLSPDGSKLAFVSSAPGLNPLGGTSDNGGHEQYYLYDDADGSLICASCPADGAAPLDGVRPLSAGERNIGPLADDGTFAFATVTPLAGADQNTTPPDPDPPFADGGPYTAGFDAYEYRDGRQILVTDGLTNWIFPPYVEGITPSGSDIFFVAPAQYTPDARDANRRLYDARIGGGIDFPKVPPPCPLEVCQGTPRGVPEEQAPSSGNFSGPGNVAATPPARCRKGKVRRKGRCVSRPNARQHKHAQKRTANRNRRAAR